MSEPTKYLLGEDRIPTHWVNLMADLPGDPLPPLSPQTMEPAGPPDLAPIFPMSLIEQEVSTEPEIEIPDEVRETLAMWRPTPLFRARRLERALDTPAHIYYKYEGVSPAGSHKTELRDSAGLLQPRGGDAQARDRDRSRPVGLGAGAGLPALRARMRGLHGRRLLRPEALPPGDDRDLGRRPSTAAPPTAPRRAARRPSTPRGASGSRSPRRSRSPPPATTRTTRSARSSTTSACTRR